MQYAVILDRWADIEGAPAPLGVSYVERTGAYNFALYSKHATGVILLLYPPADPVHPLLEHRLDALHNKSGRIWHCRLLAAVVDRARYYVYRVEGPYDLGDGHRFDRHKLLLDPYAQQVYSPPDFSRRAATDPGPNDGRAPLGVIHCCCQCFEWPGEEAPRHTHDTVIYEVHVRGFTKRANSGVSPERRGTYGGLIEKIPYLKELGITAVELLPVHLASLFSRKADGSVELDEPPTISQISADPEFAGARLIAEAWDLAAYQLGRRFPGISWLQWNGRFRDNVLSFVRGDEGTVSSLISRLYGSADLFPDTVAKAYHAYQSVNYVTSHDGFNLYDLVSYNAKRNVANGHGNTDGIDDNRSWNCGWEGDEAVPSEVLALRKRQAKNFFALLMLSNGTPMFCAGDELLHTQRGNNNPYNQDNETRGPARPVIIASDR